MSRSDRKNRGFFCLLLENALNATEIVVILKAAILDDHPIIACGVASEPDEPFPVEVVWHARTVAEALDRLETLETPDIVISDLRIPGEDTRDFWQRCTHCPFVVYSAYYFDEEVLMAHRAGARAYLTKDMPMIAVRKTLYDVAAGHRVVSQKDRAVFRQDKLMGISPREKEVLQLLFEGLSYSDIARRLDISLQSVKSHQQNIYRKLDAGSRGEAVYRALARGLLGIPEFGLGVDQS
jgi:DNA-binding NarL/FixJ family response regulator